jgi:hypothetical protein
MRILIRKGKSNKSSASTLFFSALRDFFLKCLQNFISRTSTSKQRTVSNNVVIHFDLSSKPLSRALANQQKSFKKEKLLIRFSRLCIKAGITRFSLIMLSLLLALWAFTIITSTLFVSREFSYLCSTLHLLKPPQLGSLFRLPFIYI